ncbi:hypothetical protein BDN70DRAFT_988377 [Pholiota conissans]|uniref:CxC2-like cysteine cluster KDZ transposase-associated domain-containing protein n=1 Tax=Pholiota conissans TaxID=109636 RepID=A0A9P6CZ76_9AGAR|nr:hypothetical protein BDN70DRAFT_988377 [Pholiota conissans]
MPPKRKVIDGAIDSDSDEELEIDIDATLSMQNGNATLRQHHVQYKSKLPRIPTTTEQARSISFNPDTASDILPNSNSPESIKPPRKQPSTAFSFEVLQNFEQHNLASKKPAYDYCDALRKLTDGAFPQNTPDRYNEFNRVFRVWQHLSAERRSGHASNIDSVLKREGSEKSLALRCPACPEIGFNIEKSTIDTASDKEAHKYTLFLSTDGNFRLQRKNKHDDPDDSALNNGRAYFVEEQDYIAYLNAVDQSDDRSTCAHLRAVRLQNIIKFLNAIISGVVAIQCARHGFYWTVVDLAKGECFAHTDYALARTLSDAENQRWIMLSYDIWCQYSKKIKARFSKHFPEVAPVLERLRGAVPKMHIKGHVLYCQLLWSFNYLPSSGETCGEAIEGSWAEHNQTAGSTKEMNHGHRHDTLDAFFGYWNWTKFHEMAKTLYRLYTNCIALLKKRDEKFIEFSKRFSPELIEKWTAMDIAPIIDGGQVISVYEAQIGKDGPPTQGKQYEKLLREESINELAGVNSGVGDAYFINAGLRLERDQFKIRKMALAANNVDTDAIVKSRAKLQRDILKWRSTQLTLCPSLNLEIKASDAAHPEHEPLLLPSHFSQPLRLSLGLDKYAEIEYTLREGQAHDALESVRKAIRTFNFNLKFKKEQVRGQGANTRAQNFLRTLTADKLSSAEKYRISRRALLSLGLSADDAVFQELLDTQLWSKNSAAPLKLGDSHLDDPWFWTVGRPSGQSVEDEKDWNLEMDRVKWFRDRAACQRSLEEKEILVEEFKRTIRSFERLQEAWTELGKRESLRSGKANYSFQQAEMYGRLALDCKALFTKALQKG